MSRPKPPIIPLSQLEPNQFADCFAQLAERKSATTAAGKKYFICRFRDAGRTATYMVWADGPFFDACETEWREGACYKLWVHYTEHEKYGPQIEVQQFREATEKDKSDGYDPLQFVPRSKHDPDQMFAELRALARIGIIDEPLRKLVLLILDRHADKLRWLPGTHNKYYPFAGGWLEHTLNVTHSCLYLADKYRVHYPDLSPPINRDLLLAGAMLHDIGRSAEFDNPSAFGPTSPSELIGHLFLGRDIVRDAARDVPELNPELLQMLEHLIVSHLNLPAWGSPRLPLIPESLILHHADDLDAKVEMYARCLTNDVAAGPFTDRDPILGRPLFKGRTV
jgi:3'-5' exoribonuclease